jgi:uncharacterized RDD family membrane protein YckC
MSQFFGADDPFYFIQTGFLKFIALVTGAFLWILLCIIIFSIMEGRLGYSPGKRLLGIRVLGSDLQFCGFWHALVRNLLMFVDVFLTSRFRNELINNLVENTHKFLIGEIVLVTVCPYISNFSKSSADKGLLR